ncbi:MAG: DoxX family protein [candidate division Zixibacteria bacterium]|nr:DoxX family protein [candidate division Zixibacteria bacterium]MDH3936568.1 DoxX family protein [candidate division Zixibacteria bacterium]MDH4033923.1 DoxX family protein [candidate division Zixibacteria bacterium]
MSNTVLSWLLDKKQDRYRRAQVDLGLLVLRVGLGLMMAFSHGWGKLIGFAERSESFSDPLGVGSALSLGLTVFAEFFCALAILLGLLTRAAAIPLIVTMMVAAFVVHGADPWAKKEFAMLYLVPLLTILMAGPGKYSLDHKLFGGSDRQT